MNARKFRYVVVLNNQDDFTTTPAHASIEITSSLLRRIVWHFITWRIASWLNKDLLNYELEFFDVSTDWLDAKCGCTGDCNCGKETPLGMMDSRLVEEWYDESADADYINGTLLAIEGLGLMKLITFQKYNPSPFTSEMMYFKNLLNPFLPAWMQ
jgi:hypothetical protein